MRFMLGVIALVCAGGLVGCATGNAMQAETPPTELQASLQPPAQLDVAQSLAELKQSLARVEQRVDALDAKFMSLNLEPQSKPAEVAQEPLEKAEVPKPKETAAMGMGVYAVRVGTHENTVRIVLDMAKSSKVSTTLDETENLLSIDIEGQDFTAPETKTYGANQPVLGSYQATARDGGVTLVFALKSATTVVKTASLNGPNRYVIDLAR